MNMPEVFEEHINQVERDKSCAGLFWVEALCITFKLTIILYKVKHYSQVFVEKKKFEHGNTIIHLFIDRNTNTYDLLLEKKPCIDCDKSQFYLVGMTGYGKSTLINCLLGNTKAVATSNMQATTFKPQQFDFMPAGYIIDTPGWNDYRKPLIPLSIEEQEMRHGFLRTISANKSYFLIITCFPIALQQTDEEDMVEFLQSFCSFDVSRVFVVVNKMDTVESAKAGLKVVSQRADQLFNSKMHLITSSKDDIIQLKKLIEAIPIFEKLKEEKRKKLQSCIRKKDLKEALKHLRLLTEESSDANQEDPYHWMTLLYQMPFFIETQYKSVIKILEEEGMYGNRNLPQQCITIFHKYVILPMQSILDADVYLQKQVEQLEDWLKREVKKSCKDLSAKETGKGAVQRTKHALANRWVTAFNSGIMALKDTLEKNYSFENDSKCNSDTHRCEN